MAATVLLLIMFMTIFLINILMIDHLSIKAAVPAAAADLLRTGFYSQSCPEAEETVRMVLARSMKRDPRIPASLMRLQFHDCFVNGCDASLLLDDTPTMLGEKEALSNIGSLRSFEVIDEMKEEVESVCPHTVSCADIIIMAAREAVLMSGGPTWEVLLGRKDSLFASQEASNKIMPSPRANATFLINLFSNFNLSIKDLVALSGSHSIGEARCFSIVFRLYNQSGSGKPDPTIDPGYRLKLNKLCPKGGDEEVTGDLDSTPRVFDNRYFKDLAGGRGFLNSDEVLFTQDERSRKWVVRFANDQELFFKAFVEGMIKMGNFPPKDVNGEVRRNCRRVNSQHHSEANLWKYK